MGYNALQAVASALTEGFGENRFWGAHPMKIEHIREFIRVTETMSYKQAARELFISQSNLSGHISSMEKDLGFELFERRNGTSVKLSPAGAVFLGYAQELVDLYEEAERASLAKANDRKPLRIGLHAFDGELVSKLRSASGIDLRFTILEHDQISFKALVEETIDIEITCDFSRTQSVVDRVKAHRLAFANIGMAPIVIAMQSDHPLAKRPSLRKADLKDYRILNAYPHLLMWSDAVNNMLGPDVVLKTSLKPLLQDRAELKQGDLGTDLFFDVPAAVSDHFSKRDDIVVVDRLEDCPLETESCMVYRTDDFDERYQQVVEAARLLRKQGSEPTRT